MEGTGKGMGEERTEIIIKSEWRRGLSPGLSVVPLLSARKAQSPHAGRRGRGGKGESVYADEERG